MHDKILILDFGSQVTQLIARRVREARVYSEIHPYDVDPSFIEKFVKEQGCKGIILSGGPSSVTEGDTPRAPEIVFNLGVPVLGICYGMQTMAAQLGGKVATAESLGKSREFGYAEVRARGHTKLLENIQAIEHNTQRASQIIERIRNFIRPEKSFRQAIDVNLLTREVHGLMTAELRSQHVHFSFVHDAKPAWVMGDPIQLSQVLLNVYRNALQAVAQVQTRKIVVRTSVQNNAVHVTVQDAGRGFVPETMQHVGEAFFTTKADGLGVGLSISKTIAEMHSGSLTISNAVDGGAIVELNLPTTRP